MISVLASLSIHTQVKICLSRCESAITRDYARMLSAEEAVEKWTEPLVKELQALPQVAGTTTTKVIQPKGAGERVWGLKVPEKLGSNAKQAPAQEAAIPKPLGAVISNGVAEPKIAGIAVTDGAELTSLSPAAAPEQAALASEDLNSHQEQKAPQEAAVREVPEEARHNESQGKKGAALTDATPPKAASEPASELSKDFVKPAAASRQQENGIGVPPLESLKIAPAKQSATNAMRAMRIPKEWLTKMQKR